MTKNCTNSLLSSILWVVRDAILLFLSNWFHLREEALLVLNFDNDLFCNDVETDKEIAILNSDTSKGGWWGHTGWSFQWRINDGALGKPHS